VTTINVGPDIANPTHDLSLQNGLEKFGMNLDGGARGVQEIPVTPSTLVIAQSGRKFGSWDPSVTSIEQRSWHGGRGQDDFSEDPTQFFDSQSLWTLTPGKIHNGLQWKFGSMGRNVVENLPGDMAWQKIISPYTYYATQFTSPASALTPTTLLLWLRRIGTPGTLTVSIYANDASPTPDVPTTIVGTGGTVTTTTVTDYVSQFVPVTIAPGALSTSTLYWIVVTASSTEGSHWEIGTNSGSGTSASSTNGTSWTASTSTIYHRIQAADTPRRWKPFILEGAWYVVDTKDDSTVSQVYINGDRGKVTSSTSTVITDTTPGCLGGSWTTDVWAGARVRIVNGTGEGQTKGIASNTANTLTLVSALSTTPDSTSEYVIYQTPEWQLLVSGWSAKVVRDVTVYDKIALFTVGGSTNSQQMRWNATTGQTHNFREDTDADSRGDYLATVYDTANEKTQIYIADNTTNQIRRSDVAAWGNLNFGNGQYVGDQSFRFTALAEYNNQLQIFKEDSLWTLSGKKPTRVPVGLSMIPSSNNGKACAVQDLFLYFNWAFSLEQLYGSTLSDVGHWKGEGLPSGQGYFSALFPGIGLMFGAWDVPGGVSAVYAWNKIGYHEMFRAWSSGLRIRSVFWQGNTDGDPYLWFDVNGDLVYQAWPNASLNPLTDASMRYQHEGVLTQSYVDLQSASLPKLFADVTLHLKNTTASGREVRIDYQIDNDIGTSTWYELGAAQGLPSATIALGLGNRRAIRLRYRLQTNSASTPVQCRAIVVEGFARSPVKYQYNMRIQVSDLAVNWAGLPDIPPDNLLTWLKREAQSASPLRMHSIFAALDDKLVLAEPPTILRTFANKLLHWWGGTMVITLRDV